MYRLFYTGSSHIGLRREKENVGQNIIVKYYPNQSRGPFLSHESEVVKDRLFL